MENQTPFKIPDPGNNPVADEPELQDAIKQIQEDQATIDKMADEVNKQAAEQDPIGKATGQQDDPPEQATLFKAISSTILSILSDKTLNQIYATLRDKLTPDHTKLVEFLGKNGIVDIKMLSNADIRNELDAIGKTQAIDISKEIAGLIYTSVTYSVFAAIGYYDDYLKNSLNEDFKLINELFESVQADITVLKMKSAEVENKLTSENITD